MQALAGFLGQVQAEVRALAQAVGLAQAVPQEALAEEQVVVQVLPLAQAAQQAVGLEQGLAQELAETEDLKVLPLLSLYRTK